MGAWVSIYGDGEGALLSWLRDAAGVRLTPKQFGSLTIQLDMEGRSLLVLLHR